MLSNTNRLWQRTTGLLLLVSSLSACKSRADEVMAAGKSLESAVAREQRSAEIPLTERQSLLGPIVFLAESAAGFRIESITPSEPARSLLLSSKDGLYPAALTSDGRKLAVIAVEEQGEVHLERLQIYALEQTDAGQRPVLQWTSAPAARLRNPAWAPDGSWLVFEADWHSFRDLYRVEAGGSEPQRLTHNEEGNFEPDVSADGRRIAFVSSRDGNAEVYVMSADGSEERRLTQSPTNDGTPRWSPDGRTIALTSDRDGIERIYLVAEDGSSLRRLTASAMDEPETWPVGYEPHEQDHVWSPDGRFVAFTVRTGPHGASLQLVDAAAPDKVAVLTEGRVSDRNPVFSPDGGHILFVSNRLPDSTGPAGDGELDLYLVRRDGTATLRLTDTRGAEWLPRWAAGQVDDELEREQRTTRLSSTKSR